MVTALLPFAQAKDNVVKELFNYRDQFIEQPIVLVNPPIEVEPISLAGQCVFFIQKTTGIGFTGNAITWYRYINQDFPSRGSIVVLNTKPLGHLGIIIDYDKNFVTFRSQNWSREFYIEDITIKRSDPLILGYIVY